MWLERILNAEARQQMGETPFTDDDIQASCSWYTCAVGEQLERGVPFQVEWCMSPMTAQAYKRLDGLIPFPMDPELLQAGLHFCAAVGEQNPAGAETWLAHIEERALQLKREARGS